MAGKTIAQRLRDAFLKPAQRQAVARREGLEKRSAEPGEQEKVVVDPTKKRRKKIVK